MKRAVSHLALLLLTALVLPLLAACTLTPDVDPVQSEQSTTAPEATTSAPTPDTPTDVSGTVNGQTYVNKYFDLSLMLPAHWYFESDSEIASSALTCFSNRTAQQKQESKFEVECRAVNDATNDVIEITVEKKKDGVSDPWYS